MSFGNCFLLFYSHVWSIFCIKSFSRDRSYDSRRSPLRYSRSPHYARTYSPSPDYSPSPRLRRYSRFVISCLPVMWCIRFTVFAYFEEPSSLWFRSISPRYRRYRDRSYSRSPNGSRSRSRSRSYSRSISQSPGYSRWLK